MSVEIKEDWTPQNYTGSPKWAITNSIILVFN